MHEYYSYSYSLILKKTNIIRIRIWSKIWFRILFVFVFGPKNSIRSPLFCKDIGSKNKIIIRINGLIIGMQNLSKKRFKPLRSLTSTHLLLPPSSSPFLQKIRATRQGVQHRRICSAGSCHRQAWSDDVLGRERGAYNKVLLMVIIFLMMYWDVKHYCH